MTNQERMAYQAQMLAKRKEARQQAAAEQRKYLQSEQYLRDRWENSQRFWAKKAKKEGWNYTKQPFVSAAERQAAKRQETKDEIAYLQEKIATLQATLQDNEEASEQEASE